MGDVSRHYRQLNFLSRNGEPTPPMSWVPSRNGWISTEATVWRVWLAGLKSPGDGRLAGKASSGRSPLPAAPVRDVVTTMIRCARETIFLVHDCGPSRPYSRGGRLEGTKGIWMEDNRSIFLEAFLEDPDSWDRCKWQPFDSYLEEYEHPVAGIFGIRHARRPRRHGFPCAARLSGSGAKEENTPIDVYDTASWMAITLSEQSTPWAACPCIPDFTDGRIGREPAVPGPFALDAVYPSFF